MEIQMHIYIYKYICYRYKIAVVPVSVHIYLREEDGETKEPSTTAMSCEAKICIHTRHAIGVCV